MNKIGVTVSWAVALLLFCVWSIFFGFRADQDVKNSIPAWCSYKKTLNKDESMSEKLNEPLVRKHLIATGFDESMLDGSRFKKATKVLDERKSGDAIYGRLRAAGAMRDSWIFAVELSKSSSLMHWFTMFKKPDGATMLGRHNGWPIWKLVEENLESSMPIFFVVADGMFFATMEERPVALCELLDQNDGLIP